MTIKKPDIPPIDWHDYSWDFEDILYHKSAEGIAKITINRPQVRNAFRPLTVKEMILALSYARYDANIGVIILTGAEDKAFCSGGDQSLNNPLCQHSCRLLVLRRTTCQQTPLSISSNKGCSSFNLRIIGLTGK